MVLVNFAIVLLDFRALPLEENGSPFIRTGVLSKTVILTSPYNPFNKVEH